MSWKKANRSHLQPDRHFASSRNSDRPLRGGLSFLIREALQSEFLKFCHRGHLRQLGGAAFPPVAPVVGDKAETAIPISVDTARRFGSGNSGSEKTVLRIVGHDASRLRTECIGSQNGFVEVSSVSTVEIIAGVLTEVFRWISNENPGELGHKGTSFQVRPRRLIVSDLRPAEGGEHAQGSRQRHRDVLRNSR